MLSNIEFLFIQVFFVSHCLRHRNEEKQRIVCNKFLCICIQNQTTNTIGPFISPKDENDSKTKIQSYGKYYFRLQWIFHLDSDKKICSFDANKEHAYISNVLMFAQLNSHHLNSCNNLIFIALKLNFSIMAFIKRFMLINCYFLLPLICID